MIIICCVSALVILIVVILYIFLVRWSVNVPDYMAAKHYRFGKSVSDKPISGRRVTVIPYFDQLVMIDQRVQRNTLDNINVLTNEKQVMKISATIVWKSENASMTIENIKPEDIQPTFFKIIESVIKNECSKMSVDEILVNRTVLSKNLNAILKETADTWGLKISSVNITNVVVSNDSFMRNMALPKEIEIERQAKLAQIEKDLAVELKNIERETEEKLASLKSDKIIGEEKENVNKVLEEAEKKRIYDMSVLQKSIEEISAEIEKIKARVKIENEAEKTKDLMIAEAEGLEKRIQVISAYSQEGLNYETLRALPDIYKNIKVGDVTLFQGENAGEIPAYGYIANSLLNMVSAKNAPKVAD